jgi:nitroreductase
MNTIHRDQLVKQLNWRYATKQFDAQRKITPEDWAALEEALVLTPSSYGLQPWKFMVVKDGATREKLVEASWGQRQVAEASHLVVFTVKSEIGEGDIEEYIERIAEVRGVARESLKGFRDMMVGALVQGMDASQQKAWAARQAYIALGNFLNSAAVLGIDACPMEGIEPERYDAILGLGAQGLSTVVVAAGYRHQNDPYAGLKKVRFPREKVLLEV